MLRRGRWIGPERRRVRCTRHAGQQNVNVRRGWKPATQAGSTGAEALENCPDHLSLEYKRANHIVPTIEAGHSSNGGFVMSLLFCRTSRIRS